MNEVRLTITPRWNGETVSSAAVRMTLSLPIRAGEPLFRIRVRSIDKPFAALSDDGPIRLADPDGREIPCRTEDCGEDMGTVRVYLPEVTPERSRAVLTYTVLPSPAGRNPVLDLGSEPGGVTGSGMTFLPAFFAEGSIRYILRWDLSAMPSGASGAWTWGEGDSEREGDGNTLISAFYAAGAPLDCVRVGSFRYYWFRNPKLLETAVDAARIFTYESAFFRDEGEIYSIFTRHGTECVHPGGTADNRAYLWLYREDGQLDASLKFLFAHEMVHNWINLPDEPYGTCTWYVEGAAEFYSLLLPWRAGIVSAEELTEELNRRAADYYENPRRRETNEACGRAFLSDLETTKVPYGRGLFYLLHADAAVRRASGSEKSLDDVMNALRDEARAGFAGDSPSDAANEAWLRLYGAVVGEEAARREFDELKAGAVWDPEPDAFALPGSPAVRAVSVPGTERGTGESCKMWKFTARTNKE